LPRLTIITFGYDVAPAPTGAIWTADVRNVPSNTIEGLYDLTGLDRAVQDKILATPQAKSWISKFQSEILPTLQDGDMIAIGCSIGVHRSVAIAQELKRIATDKGFDVTVKNRDLAASRDTRSTLDSMTSYEVRALGSDAISFSLDGGKPRIDARAILFDSWSADLGGFRERMLPGSVNLESDLVALFDHDSSMVLGRTTAGTMEVRTDSKGIAFTAYPPDTTWANDLRISMQRGDIRGCSFRMLVEEDNWYLEEGQVCRDVVSARVSELTITSMPAYPETTSEARSQATALKATPPATRAGRVISDSNEQLLKNAYAALELASDALETVLTQVDPAFAAEQQIEDAAEEAPMTSDPTSDGSPEMMNRSKGGAPNSKTPGTFVPGFGYITTKGK